MDKTDEITREYLMDILNTNMKKMNSKFVKGRIKNDKNEKIKIEQFRSLIYAINTLNSILKDRQVDDMAKDLTTIKEAIARNEDLYNLSSKEIEKVDKLLAEAMEE